MTAAEMRLDQAIQMCRLQADELETKDNWIRQIVKVLDEREQRLEDSINLIRNYQTTEEARFRLKELRDLRKEFEIILGQEG